MPGGGKSMQGDPGAVKEPLFAQKPHKKNHEILPGLVVFLSRVRLYSGSDGKLVSS